MILCVTSGTPHHFFTGGCFVNIFFSVVDPWLLVLIRIRASDQWIRIRIQILKFLSLTFKTQKKSIFFYVFLHITFWSYIFIIFRKKVTYKTVRIKVFLLIWLTDPDPGGQKKHTDQDPQHWFVYGLVFIFIFFHLFIKISCRLSTGTCSFFLKEASALKNGVVEGNRWVEI